MHACRFTGFGNFMYKVGSNNIKQAATGPFIQLSCYVIFMHSWL